MKILIGLSVIVLTVVVSYLAGRLISSTMQLDTFREKMIGGFFVWIAVAAVLMIAYGIGYVIVILTNL
jgi:hypothetical protein